MRLKETFSSFVQKFVQYYKDHKKRTIAIGSGILLVATLLVAILGGRNKQQSSETQIITLSSGNFSKTIDIVGNVKAVPSAAIAWGASGTIGEVYYSVGDSVSEGTVIAKLADGSISASILEAQTDLLSAQYELDRVMNSDSDFQTAAQALEDAEYDYRAKKDARDYWNFNGTDQALIDQTRSAYHTADIEVWNLQKQYDALATDDPDRENTYTALQNAILTRDKALRNLNYLLGHSYDHSVETDYIEYNMAVAVLEEARITYQRYLDNSDEIAAAQAKVQALENTVNSASIIAPFDGVITDISANVSESVSSGETGVQLDNLSNLVIEVSVSEVDVNDIKLGQTVNITFDAILSKKYQGTVTGISQAGDDSSGMVEFKVSITVTEPDDEIKPGFTAVASIIVQEIENAVLVPNLAIQSLNGNSIVMVVTEDGSIVPTPVEVEVSGDSYSVLKNSMLREGDQVVIQLDLTSISDFAGGFGGAMFLGGGGMRVNSDTDLQSPREQ